MMMMIIHFSQLLLKFDLNKHPNKVWCLCRYQKRQHKQKENKNERKDADKVEGFLKNILSSKKIYADENGTSQMKTKISTYIKMYKENIQKKNF